MIKLPIKPLSVTGVYGERIEPGSGLPSEARLKRETTFSKGHGWLGITLGAKGLLSGIACGAIEAYFAESSQLRH
jgi:hypothetical protein